VNPLREVHPVLKLPPSGISPICKIWKVPEPQILPKYMIIRAPLLCLETSSTSVPLGLVDTVSTKPRIKRFNTSDSIHGGCRHSQERHENEGRNAHFSGDECGKEEWWWLMLFSKRSSAAYIPGYSLWAVCSEEENATSSNLRSRSFTCRRKHHQSSSFELYVSHAASKSIAAELSSFQTLGEVGVS